MRATESVRGASPTGRPLDGDAVPSLEAGRAWRPSGSTVGVADLAPFFIATYDLSVARPTTKLTDDLLIRVLFGGTGVDRPAAHVDDAGTGPGRRPPLRPTFPGSVAVHASVARPVQPDDVTRPLSVGVRRRAAERRTASEPPDGGSGDRSTRSRRTRSLLHSTGRSRDSVRAPVEQGGYLTARPSVRPVETVTGSRRRPIGAAVSGGTVRGVTDRTATWPPGATAPPELTTSRHTGARRRCCDG